MCGFLYVVRPPSVFYLGLCICPFGLPSRLLSNSPTSLFCLLPVALHHFYSVRFSSILISNLSVDYQLHLQLSCTVDISLRTVACLNALCVQEDQ